MAGIYIHIPFCKSRCIYCDFYSSTLKNKEADYVEALCKELIQRKGYLHGEAVETVYLGGGTPSQLSITELQHIIDVIKDTYGWQSVKEATLEANPDDLSPEYLSSLKKLGFNRLSIGVQTFQDKILKLIKRRHNAKQVQQAVKDAHSTGFTNISIDLIYGLPEQDMTSWQEDVELAIQTGATHISAYGLTYEEGTPIFRMRHDKVIQEATDEEYLARYTYLMKRLKEGGFIHYEISNFAQPGLYSQHNSSYWKGIKYLGCGPSAHSYNGKSRQWNVASIEEYITAINTNASCFEREELNLMSQYNDFVMTSLRTMWGINLQQLTDKYGTECYRYLLDKAAIYLKNGKLTQEGDIIKLSEQGVFVSDGIISDLFQVN